MDALYDGNKTIGLVPCSTLRCMLDIGDTLAKKELTTPAMRRELPTSCVNCHLRNCAKHLVSAGSRG